MTTTHLPIRTISTKSVKLPEYDNGGELIYALTNHHVDAKVVDIDFNRVGVSVKTDYVIEVSWKKRNTTTGAVPVATDKVEDKFSSFFISKSYSAFRNLASKIKSAVKMIKNNANALELSTNNSAKKAVMIHSHKLTLTIPESSTRLITLSKTLSDLIDSEEYSYLGKVTYHYVKHMSKQRRKIIDSALGLILAGFPHKDFTCNAAVRNVATLIETFLLTDHVLEDSSEAILFDSTNSAPATPISNPYGVEVHHSHTTLSNKDDLNPPPPPVTKSTLNISAPKPQDDQDRKRNLSSLPPNTSEKDVNITVKSPVQPISIKRRDSRLKRTESEVHLKKMKSIDVIDEHDYAAALIQKSESQIGFQDLFERLTEFDFQSLSLIQFWIVFLFLLYLFQKSATFTISGDYILFFLFVGNSAPRHIHAFLYPSSAEINKCKDGMIDTSPSTPLAPQQGPASNSTATDLLRKSMSRSFLAGALQEPNDSTSAPVSITPNRNNSQFETTIINSSFALDSKVHTNIEEEKEETPIIPTLPTYPPNTEIGKYFNCWSAPNVEEFHVRGKNYLNDRKKVSSGDFVFPIRGVDLFLTDNAPENVGSNPKLLGGKLRDVPTFIVNFRLPWGVLLFYAEIPQRFLPFLRKGHNPSHQGQLPSLNDLSPPDRCVARFLMNDDKHRNKKFKIVPVVIAGPWIVRSVVGGKPAIIGKQLPMSFIYQPPDPHMKYADYLEADLDIVASAAARRILSVVRSHTQSLTLDLGFVVEGQEQDELPEQMLLASRIHGLDPIHAHPLPEMVLNDFGFDFDDDTSETTLT